MYTWAGAGGEYPIQNGDSATIQNPTVAERSVAPGDTVRVVWHGTWDDPEPEYCPHEGPDGTSTLAEQEIEDSAN